MPGLTPKQNAFVAAYLKSLNATQAAIAAGYPAKSASSKGAQLLVNVKVARCVEEALKRRAERVEVKSDDVLRELVRVFSVDIAGAYDDDGTLKKISDIHENVRRAIVGVKTKEIFEGYGENREYVGDLVEVKFADKVRAIELAMKHLGLLVDRVQHSADSSFAELLKEARSRAAKRE